MTRREFPKSVKLAAFKRADGRCEECGGRLAVGKFEYDHALADGLSGEPTLENCEVLCANFPGACHGRKTATHDIPMIAKADRLRAKHIGAKRKKPWSKFRKKMSGEVVLREDST
jgi:hypothetical protein